MFLRFFASHTKVWCTNTLSSSMTIWTVMHHIHKTPTVLKILTPYTSTSHRGIQQQSISSTWFLKTLQPQTLSNQWEKKTTKHSPTERVSERESESILKWPVGKNWQVQVQVQEQPPSLSPNIPPPLFSATIWAPPQIALLHCTVFTLSQSWLPVPWWTLGFRLENEEDSTRTYPKPWWSLMLGWTSTLTFTCLCRHFGWHSDWRRGLHKHPYERVCVFSDIAGNGTNLFHTTNETMKAYYLEASVSHTSRIVLSHSSRHCAHIPEPPLPPKMSLQSPFSALPEVSHASRNLWVWRCKLNFLAIA